MGMLSRFVFLELIIHFRVPASVKGRWVRASRAAGLKLTDYVVQAVEAYMQQQVARIVIPDALDFSALKLRRDTDGMVSFDMSVIERVCKESGIPIEAFLESSEDNLAALVMGWYQAHIEKGGDTDSVAEDLISEVRAEDAAGQNYSHAPGQA